ncbi:MAG: ester cyclase [Gemmatimonadota bacterium]|jgi:predicted ester cyclase
MRTLAAVIILSLVAACQTPPAEMTLDLEANKQVVRDLFGAIDAGDLDRVEELVTPDLALSALGGTEEFDVTVLKQMIQAFYASFPDNTHVIEGMVAEGNLVAVALVQYATHEADYEGVPATGNNVTVPAMHLMEISDGAVKRWWAIEDNLGLMQQIGMRLAPAGEG